LAQAVHSALREHRLAVDTGFVALQLVGPAVLQASQPAQLLVPSAGPARVLDVELATVPPVGPALVELATAPAAEPAFGPAFAPAFALASELASELAFALVAEPASEPPIEPAVQLVA